MLTLRRLIHLTLILVVLATAQVMGMARGQARVAGEMVICSGGAVVTIRVDADGNPVGAPHICPDCAMTLLVQADLPDMEPTRPFSLRSLAWRPDQAVSPAPQADLVPVARGPPNWV